MKRQGFTLVELLVVIAIIALLMGILMPALSRVRQLAFRLTCGTNLSGLGKAMMLYANDYQDELPKAGGRQNTWVAGLPDWTGGASAQFIGGKRDLAYGLTTAGGSSTGKVTVSSSLYLLIKYAECTPKMFLCKGESDTKEFMLRLYPANPAMPDLQSAWDFGPGETARVSSGEGTYRYCSYAYHVPFGAYALTTSAESGMAVAADRNPWFPTSGTPTVTFDKFIPDMPGTANTWKGTADQAKNGNSDAHQKEGQNVLYIDSHVDFEKRSYVGIDNDNIYTQYNTSSTQDQTMVGVAPSSRVGVDPGNKRDAYLVNDPPLK
jgi:prepilin-type N-terminal cleavage/methylation domain-containing protein